jgi:hypothetical protein
MENQRQDNHLDPQQQYYQMQVVRRRCRLAYLRILLDILTRLLYAMIASMRSPPIPYHTSALSGADWVCELLAGHPKRIRAELGVYRSTFAMLLRTIQAPEIGLQSSRHVSIEEQLAIFLYTVVTGLPCTHVGERFQRSSDTITK